MVDDRHETFDKDRRSNDYMIARDRLRRMVKAPKRYGDGKVIKNSVVFAREVLIMNHVVYSLH